MYCRLSQKFIFYAIGERQYIPQADHFFVFDLEAKEVKSFSKSPTYCFLIYSDNGYKNTAKSRNEPLFKKWLENAEKERECKPYNGNQEWIECATAKEYHNQAFNDLVKQANTNCWNNNIRPTGLIKDLETGIRVSKDFVPIWTE